MLDVDERNERWDKQAERLGVMCIVFNTLDVTILYNILCIFNISSLLPPPPPPPLHIILAITRALCPRIVYYTRQFLGIYISIYICDAFMLDREE